HALNLDTSWYTKLNEEYAEGRKKVFEIMDLLGGKYSLDQAGLFVWAQVPSTYSGCYALSDKVLYDAKVCITPGGIFGTAGEQFIRISLCANQDTLDTAIIPIKEHL